MKPARDVRRPKCSSEYLYEYSVWIVSPSSNANSHSADPDDLGLPADQMHLDALLAPDVVGPVRECVEVEVGVELAVDPREQVEVERGGDAPAIVVGGPDDRFVLVEVEADQEAAAVADEPGDRAEQSRRPPSG